jgi:hypothetical protein
MTSPITPKATRAISFSPDVRVKKTLHLNNYSNDEIDACWYNEAETKAIREQARRTVEQMQAEADLDGPKYCTRGLEILTAEGRRQRMENRFQAWDAVLNEQERQVEEGIWEDDEATAARYGDCCYASMVTASMQGVSDQRVLDVRTKKTMPARSPQPVRYRQSRLVR